MNPPLSYTPSVRTEEVNLHITKQRELGREEFKSERENGEAETDAAVGGRVGGKIKFGVSS